MNRIKEIQFHNHPVLGDLKLDFTDKSGNPVDTVIFAGDNGTGKSTILDALYKFATGHVDFECIISFISSEKEWNLEFYRNNNKIAIKDLIRQKSLYSAMDPYNSECVFKAIFSDVDINFKAKAITQVTSEDIDLNDKSKRSDTDIATKIKQLLIDIQTEDDTELAKKYRQAVRDGQPTDKLYPNQKMDRFTNAFASIFDDLTYDGVENSNSHKDIIFRKTGVPIRIDDLSSGEKQIVYRGCFLLRDVNVLKDPFVFIDEPEISLHPRWQEKIMDFYKKIFTDDQGIQTSQIFAVTHSPFIIHNDSRRDDKVIVLKRNKSGIIEVSDRPEYYKCNSIEVVQDAFSIDISSDQPTVYLEGRTDEKYFNKALEVYGFNDANVRFRWVGHIDKNGQETNTGKEALNKAAQFLRGTNSPIKKVCLFDCDAGKSFEEENNVIVMSIPKYKNSKNISAGIENALVLDNVDIEKYRIQTTSINNYGITTITGDFKKMACCENICGKDVDTLKPIFCHLKNVIEDILEKLSTHL